MAKTALVLGSSVGGAQMLPTVYQMPYLNQGSTNACGTTSLAMAMTYLGVRKTHEEIDDDIRRMDIFTSPQQLIRYARIHGLEAEGYNGGTFEQLTSHISLGHPCICIIDANYDYPSPYNSSITGFHYVVIDGYALGPAGKESTSRAFLLFHDPNIGDDPANNVSGADMAVSAISFFQFWDVGYGFHNYFVSLAKKGEYLPKGIDVGVEAPIALLDGISRLSNGIAQFAHPHNNPDYWIGAIPNIVSGIVQIFVAFPAALSEALGLWINQKVDGIPLVQNVVKPAGDILMGAGAAIGDIASGVGAVTDDLTSAVVNLTNGDLPAAASDVGQSVVDTATAIGNGVTDTVNSAVNAVADLFSW